MPKAKSGPAASNDAAFANTAPRSFMGRTVRLGIDFFWYGLGSVLSTGLPQLVLFPVCLHVMGPAAFGKFIWAMGVVSMVGITPTRGLTNTLMREFTGVSNDRKPLLLRTGFTLAIALVSVLMVVVVLACAGIGLLGSVEGAVVVTIVVLSLAFAAQNLVQVGIVDLNIARRFAMRTFWQNLGGTLCFLALPGFYLIGASGVSIGYTLGHVAAALMLLTMRHRVFFGVPQFERRLAGQLGTMWFLLSISSFCFVSVRYIHRTILGYFTGGQISSEEYVSIFFAAVGTLEILAMPIATLGRFGLPILASHASHRSLSQRWLKRYAVASVIGVGYFYVVAIWLAPHLVRLFYGKVAAQAPIAGGVAIGTALSILMHTARPFVIKFAPRRTIVALGGLVLGAHFIPALLLIPSFGLSGAVWSYCIGAGTAGVAWFLVFLNIVLRPPADELPAESIDDLGV